MNSDDFIDAIIEHEREVFSDDGSNSFEKMMRSGNPDKMFIALARFFISSAEGATKVVNNDPKLLEVMMGKFDDTSNLTNIGGRIGEMLSYHAFSKFLERGVK